MESIIVYQADALGFFIYPTTAYELGLQPGDYNVPYGAKRTAPPEAPAGFVARSSGPEEWILVEDHRKDELYYVATPAVGDTLAVYKPYSMGTLVVVDGQEFIYDGGGPVPSWLAEKLTTD